MTASKRKHKSLLSAAHLVLAIGDDGRGRGFSTAVELSHISGRGVGMDAMRSAMEGIGGSVRAEVLEDAPRLAGGSPCRSPGYTS